MKKYCKLVILLLLPIFVYSQESENSIEWQPNRKLSWQDFRGRTLNWPVAAVTYCGIKMEPLDIDHDLGKATYKIVTYFIKDSSFYFKEKADSIVLKHEQSHFDIAELYARKMRQGLSVKNYVTSKEANTIYNRFYKEYLDFQKRYEERTKHGTNVVEQNKWSALIYAELKRLDKFKASISE